MAELNLNYEPAWLQQRPDSNQPMSLAEAFQLKQRQQQIDTEKALLPLRQQEMQAQVANMALDRQIQQEKLSTMLKAKAGSAELWGQMSQIDWDNPADVSKLYGTISKYGIADPQALQVIQANTKLSAAAQLKMNELETRTTIAEMKADMPQRETALQDAIDNQLADENRILVAQGKPAMTQGEAAQRRAELRANAPILGGGKKATQVFDVNGNLLFSETSGGGMPQGITPGLQTTAQKEILSNKKAFDIAHDLESSVSPSSVGAVAVVKHFVFDKALAQIDPSLADNKRIDDITKLVTAKNQLARLITSDPRFSNEDRKQAAPALPDPLNPVESYPNVVQKLKTLQGILKRRSYQDSISQGITPPYWSMPTQDEVVSMFKKKKSELQRAVQENKMKSAAANAAIMREMADAQEVLEEQYGIPPRPQQ